MLITPLGEPIPPQSVVQRLAEVDPRLSLKWVPSAVGAPYWGIIETWTNEDARWELINNGLVPRDGAYDLRMMLPSDCSAEEAEGIVLRFFTRTENAQKEAEAKVEKITKANKARKAKITEEFLQDQIDQTVRTSKHELELVAGAAEAHPISSGFGEGTIKAARTEPSA